MNHPRWIKVTFKSRRHTPASARSTPVSVSNQIIRFARRVPITRSTPSPGNDESPYERPRPRNSRAPRARRGRSSPRSSMPGAGRRPHPERVGSVMDLDVGRYGTVPGAFQQPRTAPTRETPTTRAARRAEQSWTPEEIRVDWGLRPCKAYLVSSFALFPGRGPGRALLRTFQKALPTGGAFFLGPSPTYERKK